MGQLASSVVKTSIEITLNPDPFICIKGLVVRVTGGVITTADEHVMIIVPETTAVAPPTASTVN